MQNYFKWKTGIATPNESKASYGARNCKSMEYKPQNVICQNCSGEFIIEPDDFSFYEKMKVPAPHVCPDCRFKMRAIFRNEMTLYTGLKCALCEKNILSIYNPSSAYTVYCNSCYSSDNWDAGSYSMDYDFNRSFFEQYKELIYKVPKNNLYLTHAMGPIINSDYTNCIGGLKNCYLIFNSGEVEDSGYSRGLTSSVEVYDSYFAKSLEQCYENINCYNSNKLFWSQNAKNCVDSFLLLNCTNLINCFGCVNLNNKSYCYFNEQLTKEDYTAKISSLKGSYKAMLDQLIKFEEFKLKFPRRVNNNLNALNLTGDYLFDCNDVQYSFEGGGGENSKFTFSARDFKDCHDILAYGIKGELLLNCVSVGFASHCIGSVGCENCQNIEYSIFCKHVKDLIGCDGIKNSEYCILNKKYTKEEYEKIREHIVKELTDLGIYGLMMPPSIAPFAYNETIAQDNMPLTKEEAIAQGFRWEEDIQKTEGKETIKPEQIPDHIRDVGDSIAKEILCCIECNRNYKITEQELLFYRKMILPIPRKCFYCRHKSRIEKRGPYKFWNRNCAKCEKEIITNYSPERPEIVYCERCYQSEVY